MSVHRRTHGSTTGSRARRRRLIVLSAAVAATVLVAGCGSSSSPSAGASSAGASSAGASSPAAAMSGAPGAMSGSSGASAGTPSPSAGGASGGSLAAIQAHVATLMKPSSGVDLTMPAITGMPDLKGKTVLVVPALGLVFATAIKQVTTALGKVGVTVQTCDGQGNPSTISSCLSQAPSIKGIAGVMVIGFPYQGAPDAFNTLAKKNIPVLIAQQNADGQPTSNLLAFVGTTNLFKVASEAADDYVIATSNGKANVLALGLDESQDVRDATKHMSDYLTSSCPGCKVTTKSVPSMQISSASNLVSAAVLQNPDLDWLVSLNSDVSGQSVVKGLQSSNAATKVKQGGIGNGVLSLQQVSAGQATYAALISGELLAYNWSDALLRLIAHNPVPTNYPVVVRLIDKSNIGELKIAPEEALTFNWFGSKDTFASAYGKLWGAA